jgi:hypothetical protein
MIALVFFYQTQNANFTTANSTLDMPYEAKYDVATHEEKEELKSLLTQRFFYMAKGKQSFAFESEDGKYILKIMKCERLKVHPLYKVIPEWCSSVRKNKQQEKQKKKEALFQSYLLAATVLKEKTGVVVAHLNFLRECGLQVELQDKLGFQHQIDLSQSPFVIQRKIRPFSPYIKALWQQGEKELAEHYIFELIETLAELSRQGVRDADPSLIAHNNVGILDGKIAYIDIGTFKKVNQKQSSRLLKKDYKSLQPLLAWLQKKDPQFAAKCQEKISQHIHAEEIKLQTR